jgi:hypothetical protein
MMKRIRSMKIAAVLASSTLLLAGCGGSDNYVAPAPPPADDGLSQAQREDRAASTSVAGLFAFAVALVNGATEVSEPRVIDGITPPAADHAEPMAFRCEPVGARVITARAPSATDPSRCPCAMLFSSRCFRQFCVLRRRHRARRIVAAPLFRAVNRRSRRCLPKMKAGEARGFAIASRPRRRRSAHAGSRRRHARERGRRRVACAARDDRAEPPSLRRG